MNEFNLYLKLGLEHVLDVSALDHVLFLAALVIPYLFKDFKNSGFCSLQIVVLK